MADEIATPPAAPEGIPAEVHQMMQASLTGVMPQTGNEPPAAPIVTDGNTPPAIPQTEQIVDANEYLKTMLGFDNWETAKTEFETLKQKAQTPQEFNFENEQSKTLAKAIAAGKVQEVYQMLDEQLRIDRYLTNDVTEDIAGDIIKLGLRLNHKDLTDQEIEYKYNKQYGLPKEPALDIDDEDSVERHNAWKEQVADIKMSKIIDAKLARPQLETAKTKLVLPNFDTPVDEGYLQYKKSLEDAPKIQAEMRELYKKITPELLETKLNFNDETNKIAFEFQYKPDSESFSKSVDMALDVDKFLNTFQLPDGTFDNAKFVSALHFAMNKDTYLMEAMKQAKNATIKASLPDNSGSGLNRQMPATHEPTELDKQMQRALAPFQNNGRQVVN